jgi:hypothetical protein
MFYIFEPRNDSQHKFTYNRQKLFFYSVKKCKYAYTMLANFCRFDCFLL